nr:integrase, catalytic region, zinc finger, CCHC-type, peptidase aspartic, catalytic [Tanacetum cinerariifolium]
MTLETHNWSSSAHQELYKIVKDEIFPIVNQVDARVQNFVIQFLKEAAKFVGDFTSLAKEADESIAKQKALELEIERLLKAVFSQDILENVHLNTTYKNMFDSISVSRTQTKTIIASLQKQIHNSIYKNAKLRAQLFNKVFDQKDNKRGTSANTKFAKQSIVENLPKVGETHALSKPVTSNSDPMPQESKVVKNDKVIAPEMFRINPFKTSREEKHVPNNIRASTRTKPITVSQHPVITKKDPKVKKPKQVGVIERLATPKPRTPRILLRWSPTGRLFDQKGKIVDSVNPRVNLTALMVIQICLWCIDSGFSKHMTGNLKLLINFVWKFMGTVRFRIDHVAAILGFGDLQWGNILITRVYFIEGLGLPKFKYNKKHLCPSCEQRKSKRATHPPKPVPNSRQRLHLLHMDLCGPMRIASINGKRYVLVIVDDYSRYTWVHFLRSKDEAPEVIKTFLKRITVLLQSPVIIIRTDNGTEFKNQVLKEYFDTVGISYQISSVRTSQQNGVAERQNRTLVDAARTMLIFSCAPLFLWAEAIATVCFTQNRSIIHRRFNKTPYELINGRKPDISFLNVFGALCYPKNDRKDIRKLGTKGDIGFFICYSANSCAYRIYNQRTKKIMKTMNVSFDELSAMGFKQRSSKPGLQ